MKKQKTPPHPDFSPPSSSLPPRRTSSPQSRQLQHTDELSSVCMKSKTPTQKGRTLAPKCAEVQTPEHREAPSSRRSKTPVRNPKGNEPILQHTDDLSLATESSVKKSTKKPYEKPKQPAIIEEEQDEELDLDEDLEEPFETEPMEPFSEGSSDQLPAVFSPTIDIEEEKSRVARHDPLRSYLEDLKHYPMLQPSEEFALATRLIEKGDIHAAKALVSANLRLVVKIAFEYRTFYSNLLDLIQEGNIGLMKAVSKFDPTKGARLGYYASWWIRSYILKYLLDNFRLVRVGTTQAQKKLFYHLMREKERLESQGLLAGPKLLAEKLNVREKDVIEMEQRLSGRGAEMSLDAPASSHSESDRVASHMDLLVDPKEGADSQLAHDELLQLLKDRLPSFEQRLNEKEQKLLRERLLAETPKTLQEIADQYGLTRERARQIEVKVIEKLRAFLAPELLDPSDKDPFEE